jgi:hypothetical protein
LPGEGIAESLYYSWSKEFLEAGKRRLSGDTARAATRSEVKDLRRQAQELKEVVAKQALALRLLRKSMIGDGEDEASGIPLPRSSKSSAWSSGRTCRWSHAADTRHPSFNILPMTTDRQLGLVNLSSVRPVSLL